ncbi:MAG: transglycosylase SLT domain-containing protein [Terriglobales bacterium]
MRTHPLVAALLVLTLVSFPVPEAQQSESQPAQAQPSAQSKSSKTAPRKKTRKKPAAKPVVVPPRVQQVTQAFVASADLKPMAIQLLDNRTSAAYAGVEAYAVKHREEAAGALAWLVIGYARTQDSQYEQAVQPLKNARAHAGELGDYVDYFLAGAQLSSGDARTAVGTLDGFEKRYADSLLLHDALMLQARALLAAGEARGAVQLLEARRTPARADVELALGRAYAAAGQTEAAADAWRRAYFTMPLASDAEEAGNQLKSLSERAKLPPPTQAERKQRADLLLQGKRYREAAEEYRNLLSESHLADENGARLGLGAALFRNKKYREARQVLGKIPESADERNAERLYYLAEMARGRDSKRFADLLQALRDSAPQSPWLEQILLSSGNAQLLLRNFDTAARFYTELYTRFPNGNNASYAHWKAAWLRLRLGDNDQARRLVEEQIKLYPAGAEVPNALYWRGRLAEEEQDLNKARAYYQKLSERFRFFYYAELARERLREIKIDGDAPALPLLSKIPPATPPVRFNRSAAPADSLRVQKAFLLQNGALFDLAIAELEAAYSKDGSLWAMGEMVRIYQSTGRYYRALQTLKRGVPGYFSFEIADLPRPFWEALFPRLYWSDIQKYSAENQLDPFLVAGVIRQESEFHAGAVSRARALGLMQILPSTGRKLAREMKIRRFSTNMLWDPTVNVQMGTRYFRGLLDSLEGTPQYALAAYNAGPDRVADWRAAGPYRDVNEFVESIPFTETREYVQAVMRNAAVYRRLYGTP